MFRRARPSPWSASCSNLTEESTPKPVIKKQVAYRGSLSLSLDGRKNGDVKASATSGVGTPPADRKSKLSTLSKIFRPWKWKRKKKSERIEKTAVGE